MNTIKHLSKANKINILKAIQKGEIKPESINPETVIISEKRQAFNGMMAGLAARKAGKKNNVIFVGDAKKAIDETMATINAKRQN